jgi:hypothetical protein
MPSSVTWIRVFCYLAERRRAAKLSGNCGPVLGSAPITDSPSRSSEPDAALSGVRRHRDAAGPAWER